MDAPPIPPPPQEPKKAGGWFNLGTFIFIAFMFVVGSGLLLTRLTGFSVASALPTTTSLARVPTVFVRPTSNPVSSPTPDLTIKIYITGEIQKPGVYVMRAGDRIEDALNLAGGFTAEADQSRLDLAQRVKDEMQIVVPARALPSLTPPPGGIILPATVTTALTKGPVNPTPAKAAIAPTRPSGKINLNLASLADLESLPGVGQVLAQRILDYRTKNGPFKSFEELKKIQGLTNATLDKIKDLVSF